MNKTITIMVRFFLLSMTALCIGGFMLRKHIDTEYNKDHPKTKNLDELKAWAQTSIVNDYCERYSYVKSINNETKQQEELSRVENSRMLNVPKLVRNVIEENDLPDSYADDLYNYVDAEIAKCR